MLSLFPDIHLKCEICHLSSDPPERLTPETNE
jgi:hypothetical protein